MVPRSCWRTPLWFSCVWEHGGATASSIAAFGLNLGRRGGAIFLLRSCSRFWCCEGQEATNSMNSRSWHQSCERDGVHVQGAELGAGAVRGVFWVVFSARILLPVELRADLQGAAAL